jgi:hypothetical protein
VKTRGVFIPFLCFLISTAAAQEVPDSVAASPRHFLAFSSGLNRGAVRDEMMSPMMYAGMSLPLQLTYLYRGPEIRHSLLLSFSTNDLTSSITDARTSVHTISRVHLELSYALATKVLDLEALRTSCFAGVALSGLLDVREHYFQKDVSHMNVDQMAGLGIGLLAETRLQEGSKNILRCEVGIPILTYTFLMDHYNPNVRSTIDNLNEEDDVVWELVKRGQVVSFAKLFEIRAAVSYLLMFTDHVGLDLQYRFHYYSYSEYEGLLRAHVLTNQFLLGVTVAI